MINVVSVEEGESAYELVITYANGTKKDYQYA